MSRLLQHSAVRYLGVGGAAFLLDLGLLTLAYRVFGAPLWVATGIGFWGSFAFNFTLQRRFAFGGQTPTGRALIRYCVLLGVNSAINILVVELFERAGWGFATGKLAVTAGQTVWNYFVYRYWVFSAGPSANTLPPAVETPTTEER
ncbi:GtrA family protein [Oerskovia enterophila]|uniref:GtrA family protein n=1 Tax=Oerskovia enterophila TaxID=43678 RepID=UPI0037F8FDFD